MSRDRVNGHRRLGRVFVAKMLGACVFGGAAAVVLPAVGGAAIAQQPPLPPPGMGPPPPPGARPPSDAPVGTPAGPGTMISSDPKLLAPLPAAPEEAVRRDPPSPDPRILGGTWASKPQAFPTGAMPQLPLTESGKRRVEDIARRQQQASAEGKTLLTESGRCRPMQGIGIGSELFPAEIIQGRDKIVILNEEGRGRWVIHLNGNPPPDLKPTAFGYSTGRWEGDTLVVETVGLRSNDGAFGRGLRSDQGRVVSRLRKSDGGRELHLETTIYDPETYTQPVEGGATVSTWHPELSVLEFQCEENPEGAREGMVG